jgi:hypothetical protein
VEIPAIGGFPEKSEEAVKAVVPIIGRSWRVFSEEAG